MARTLVVHPGALGDVLLAVPALRALRAAAPGGELALAAQPRIAALLAALGVVDRPLAFDGLGLDALFTEDGAAPGALRDAARVVCWFGARDPVFVRRLTALAPGAVVAPPAGRDGPVWEHLVLTVGAVPDARWRAPLAPPPPLVAEGRRRLGALGWDGRAPLVVLHPGAGSVAKRWAAEGFAAAIGGLAADGPFGIVVHQARADADAVGALLPRLPRAALTLEAPSLPCLAGVLAHARAYLGNDSGVSHLAAALGVPSVVLFRPEHLAWAPWAAAARVLVVEMGAPAASDVARVRDALQGLVG